MSDAIVLAIKADDSFMHVAPAGALLEHVSEIPGDPSPELEFYDSFGQPLRIENGALVAVAAAGCAEGTGTPDAQLLVDRIDVVLARTQVALDRATAPLTIDGRAVRRVPRVQGELPEVLRMLAALGGELTSHADPGPATGWHAFYHLLGLKH